MVDLVTPFNLDELTVDPTDIVGQSLDTNTALKEAAKTRAAQYSSILDAVKELSAISLETSTDNERRKIEGAIELERMYQQAEEFLVDIQDVQNSLQRDLTSISAQSVELIAERNNQKLGVFGKVRNAIQSQFLADRAQRALQVNQNLNTQKNTYMQSIQVQTDRIQNHIAVKNQAESNIDNFSRAMQLENRLKEIEIAISRDNEIINQINSRVQVDPSAVSAEERDKMPVFEMMHLMQHGSTEGFGKESSRNLQALYSELDQEDRTALQWATFEYERGKAAGITLDPEELIALAMQNSDIKTAETLSKFYQDPTLYETIQSGKQALYLNEFNTLYAQATKDLKVGEQLSDAEIRNMQQMAQKSVDELTSRQLFGAIQNTLNDDVRDFVSNQGTSVFSNFSETAADLVSDNYPLVKQYLNSDAGKLALSRPSFFGDHGQLSILSKFVEDMRAERVPDQQIFNGLAEFAANAAKASYSKGSEYGIGTQAQALSTLESFGMSFTDKLIEFPYPATRTLPRPAGQERTFSGSASDLQKAVEAFGQFRVRRESTLRSSREQREHLIRRSSPTAGWIPPSSSD